MFTYLQKLNKSKMILKESFDFDIDLIILTNDATNYVAYYLQKIVSSFGLKCMICNNYIKENKFKIHIVICPYAFRKKKLPPIFIAFQMV